MEIGMRDNHFNGRKIQTYERKALFLKSTFISYSKNSWLLFIAAFDQSQSFECQGKQDTNMKGSLKQSFETNTFILYSMNSWNIIDSTLNKKEREEYFKIFCRSSNTTLLLLVDHLAKLLKHSEFKNNCYCLLIHSMNRYLGVGLKLQ